MGITTNRRQFLSAALATPLAGMLYQHQASAQDYCDDLYAHRDGLGDVRTCVKPLAMLHAVYGRSSDYKDEDLTTLYDMPLSELFGRESFKQAIDSLTVSNTTPTNELADGETRLTGTCLLTQPAANMVKQLADNVVKTTGADRYTTRDYIVGAYGPDEAEAEAEAVYCAAFRLNDITGFPVLFIGQYASLQREASRRLTNFLHVFGDLTVDGLLREPMYSRLGERHPYADLVDDGKEYRIFGRHMKAKTPGSEPPIFECEAETAEDKGPGYVCEDDVQPQPACILGNPAQYCTMENNTCSIISDVI